MLVENEESLDKRYRILILLLGLIKVILSIWLTWEIVTSVLGLYLWLPSIVMFTVLFFSIPFPGFIVLANWTLVRSVEAIWLLAFVRYFPRALKPTHKNLILAAGTLPFIVNRYVFNDGYETHSIELLLVFFVLVTFAESSYSLFSLAYTWFMNKRTKDPEQRKKAAEAELAAPGVNILQKLYLKEELKALDSIIRLKANEAERKQKRIDRDLRRLAAQPNSRRKADLLESIGDKYTAIEAHQKALEYYQQSNEARAVPEGRLLEKIKKTKTKLGIT